VNVTPMAFDRKCKVSDWGHSLADLEVRVRCFTRTGAADDTNFTATYARPGTALPGKRFAYVWADQASAASYVPDARYQYNSERDHPVRARSPSGAAPGRRRLRGSANVTAYGSGITTCKLVGWQPSGPDELVDVACHNSAGGAVDSRFTMT